MKERERLRTIDVFVLNNWIDGGIICKDREYCRRSKFGGWGGY